MFSISTKRSSYCSASLWCRIAYTQAVPLAISSSPSQTRRKVHLELPLFSKQAAASHCYSTCSSPSSSSSSSPPFNPPPSHPLAQIRRLDQLLTRANATNSKIEKQNILSNFTDLEPLLSYIYDPLVRMHLTSKAASKVVDEYRISQTEEGPTKTDKIDSIYTALKHLEEQDIHIPNTLLELFELLSQRKVTGGNALAMVYGFLEQHGILGELQEHSLVDDQLSIWELFGTGGLKNSSLDSFLRCLDRNLRAGFSHKTLLQAFPKSSRSSTQPLPSIAKGEQEIATKQPPKKMNRSNDVALGVSVSRDKLPELFDSPDKRWFASRKLDGIRCVVVVEFALPLPDTDELTIVNITPYSRSQRVLSNLERLMQEIKTQFQKCPPIRQLLDRTLNSLDYQPETLRLVLDGEACILTALPSSSPSTTHFKEDFKAISSAIKRKNSPIPNPAFFPFDLLTEMEFFEWKNRKSIFAADSTQASAYRLFFERIDTVSSVVDWVTARSEEAGKIPLLRRLEQIPIRNLEEIDKFVGEASAKGWEGAILRQDTHYEGKRSSSIRKFKEWQDAEYTVEDIETATMRLPINGVYSDHRALASITIRHKGTAVSVGSGFTSDQRVEFASDPHLIIGKQVTVEYFEESQCEERDRIQSRQHEQENQQQSDDPSEKKTLYSLRFPRIKHVWMEGQRDM